MDSSGRVCIARNIVFDEKEFPYSSDPSFSGHSKSQIIHTPYYYMQPLTVPCVSSDFISSTYVEPNLSSQEQAPTPSQVNDYVEIIPENLETETSPLHTNTTLENLVPNESNLNNDKPEPPQEKPMGHPVITRSKAGIFKPKIYLAKWEQKDIELLPSCTAQALANKSWNKAMEDEFKALQLNNTWELVEPNKEMKIVGNKWVYKLKYNPDGSIARHKARLVAKGYHQIAGVNYTETFSPVAKSATVKVVLGLAVNQGWDVNQIDVNNAYLNGDLNEEVFMDQCKGFVDKKFPNHLCRSKKVLYGLKQAPRTWYEKLRCALPEWGFKNAISDTSLFYTRSRKELVIVLVYVGDILVTGSEPKQIQGVIEKVKGKFALKELGSLSYFLGR